MIVRYRNQYTINEEMMKDYVNKVQVPPMRRFGIPVGILALILTVVNISKQDWVIAAVFGISFLLIAFSVIVAPKRLLKLQKEAHKDSIGVVTSIAFGDKIRLKEGDKEDTMEYVQIRDVVFLDRCWMLMTGKDVGIMLDPDGFIVGDKDRFLDYLMDKCPEVAKRQKKKSR